MTDSALETVLRSYPIIVAGLERKSLGKMRKTAVGTKLTIEGIWSLVRDPGQSGRHLLNMSSSGFNPSETLGSRLLARRVPCC
jgi:hypothetical protein